MRKQIRVSAVPAVRDDHDYCSAAQDASCPLVVEGLDRFSDAGAAGPVGHRLRHPCHRLIHPTSGEMPSDASQPRGEQERFELLAAGRDGMHKMEQHPSIAFHGAADVADQDQRAGFRLASPMGEIKHLAAVGQTLPH